MIQPIPFFPHTVNSQSGEWEQGCIIEWCADEQDFKSATTGVAAKAMRNELNRMVANVTDPAKKKVSHSGLTYHLSPFCIKGYLPVSCSPTPSASALMNGFGHVLTSDL